jgi:hypothetical protein
MTPQPQDDLSDNPGLSKKRSYRETPDVASALIRLIRSTGKRIATEDPESLVFLHEMEEELRNAWAVAIAGIRSTGATDRDIGLALGVTKQAVAQRWPRHELRTSDAAC